MIIKAVVRTVTVGHDSTVLRLSLRPFFQSNWSGNPVSVMCIARYLTLARIAQRSCQNLDDLVLEYQSSGGIHERLLAILASRPQRFMHYFIVSFLFPISLEPRLPTWLDHTLHGQKARTISYQSIPNHLKTGALVRNPTALSGVRL